MKPYRASRFLWRCWSRSADIIFLVRLTRLLHGRQAIPVAMTCRILSLNIAGISHSLALTTRHVGSGCLEPQSMRLSGVVWFAVAVAWSQSLGPNLHFPIEERSTEHFSLQSKASHLFNHLTYSINHLSLSIHSDLHQVLLVRLIWTLERVYSSKSSLYLNQLSICTFKIGWFLFPYGPGCLRSPLGTSDLVLGCHQPLTSLSRIVVDLTRTMICKLQPLDGITSITCFRCSSKFS